MQVSLNSNSLTDYRRFLAIRGLPSYQIRGHAATFPDEYAERITGTSIIPPEIKYKPLDCLFDYQSDIATLAIRKRKFCVFADCGLGKTLIFLEFARAALDDLRQKGKRLLIVSPLMVIEQTIAEAERFHDVVPEQVRAADLQAWLNSEGAGFGIANYEALREDITAGNLGGLIADESSMLKSHYGKWGTKLLELGRGLDWKLACTGTPAPNDRIEYANHAVFMDAFSSVNAFLATFFVNKGQTSERWIIKPHALSPFYRALSHWCIFLTNPATYGWTDNSKSIPPIKVHHHYVPLTEEQLRIIGRKTGELFATDLGGITSRSSMGQIAKGYYKGQSIDTNKPAFIRELIESWPEESTLVWCKYNAEQQRLEKELPDAASITGATPHDERIRLINSFKQGEIKVLISKPKILGFGLNLQIATRQVFSGLQDSYEEFYQAVKRSNRIGSTRPLNVHLPMTDIEEPMIENVLRKAKRVQHDTDTQEQLFKRYAIHDFR